MKVNKEGFTEKLVLGERRVGIQGCVERMGLKERGDGVRRNVRSFTLIACLRVFFTYSDAHQLGSDDV